MPTPTSTEALLALLRKSGLATDLDKFLKRHPLPATPAGAAAALVEAGLLTRFQARHLLAGKHRGFLVGPYKVLGPIGKGGMGAIYLAEHTRLSQQVAIKVLLTKRLNDPAALKRFYREARVVAALDHPNIVRAYDVGSIGNLHYFVMEHVKGKDLEDVLRAEGPLPYWQAVDYALQAATALEHAHHLGVIHRDIKPSNLMLDEEGTIKVLDMGLARFRRRPSDDVTCKLSDTPVLGTADYIAPEQALNSHDADIRSDIYSLGATLYALIQGQPPFAGRSIAAKLIAHQMHRLPLLHEVVPGVPEGLSAVLDRMMAKKPKDRYQVPAEVIEALAPWAVPRVRWAFWRPLGVAAAALALVMAGTWWLTAGRITAAPQLSETEAKR